MRDNTVEPAQATRKPKGKKGNPRRTSSSARKSRMARRTLTTWLARKGLTPEAIDDSMRMLQAWGVKTPPLDDLEECPYCGTANTFVVSGKERNGKNVAMMLCCRAPYPPRR